MGKQTKLPGTEIIAIDSIELQSGLISCRLG
jgi:hypothetical protein